ncbi:MAG: protein translocase subunit SecF [Tepidiphilus sp.]|uniref:protein translocase subunit SecF n=1 Tax=Tepidiphilus succinatimandens TaxID=224436 RepID=UPI00112F516D|nr:protein translocase subunit SecF [Tepidiphilus succinatimandens]MBP6998062.1 protein translocase subunit SecF [Tepidiphilus sp.]MDK2796758.1 preprotein translocase subunit SecF [Tepidiphilus sp.]
MELFHPRQDIPFMRHALWFNAVSLLTFVAAVLFLALRGLNLSIEFTGGTLVEVRASEAVALEAVRDVLAQAGLREAQVQNFGSARDLLIRLPHLGDGESAQAGERVKALLSQVPGANFEVRRVEFVGPQVGKELATNGLMALAFVVFGIVAYLAMRFEWRFAVSAIIANLHDVVIILGAFAAFQWEFSLSVLAAVLAVLGYSVNETVVIFDRVREVFKQRRGKMDTPAVLDHAITATMSRTIITHASTLAMVVTILLFGGETLHYFALALTIGIVFGIYSSIFVSAALVMWFGVTREDLVKPAKKKEEAVV